MTTVRQRLAEWGVPVEALLDVDLDANQFPGGLGDVPDVQAWCDAFELVVHVKSPPPPATALARRHRDERVAMTILHEVERGALDE